MKEDVTPKWIFLILLDVFLADSITFDKNLSGFLRVLSISIIGNCANEMNQRYFQIKYLWILLIIFYFPMPNSIFQYGVDVEAKLHSGFLDLKRIYYLP